MELPRISAAIRKASRRLRPDRYPSLALALALRDCAASAFDADTTERRSVIDGRSSDSEGSFRARLPGTRDLTIACPKCEHVFRYEESPDELIAAEVSRMKEWCAGKVRHTVDWDDRVGRETAAALLGRSARTVGEWPHDKLPFRRIGGGPRKYSLIDIAKLAGKNRSVNLREPA